MKQIKLILFLLVIVPVLSANSLMAQTKVGDVVLKKELSFSGEKMFLNGAGMREKMWMDLYVGSLYLQSKSNDSEAIINNDAPMAIRLEIVSGMVTQSKMTSAINEGFSKSTSGKTTNTQKSDFIACFNDEIIKGDIFDIVYKNGKTMVYKNGKEKGTVEGLEFKKATFAVWLGKKPADSDLKKGMLGK